LLPPGQDVSLMEPAVVGWLLDQKLITTLNFNKVANVLPIIGQNSNHNIYPSGQCHTGSPKF
jgi:hypothetical protein